MNKHENFRPTERETVAKKTLSEFLDTYRGDDVSPIREFDGEQISFPNHFLSGIITDEFGKRLLIVRNADHDATRVERRQRLEQFYFAATLDMETGEEIIYDVSTNIERTVDPHKQHDATYRGAMAIKLENSDGHAATLVMESHVITWIENKRELQFEQLT